MHDLLIVGIPLFAILAGILFNRSDIKDLRAEMRSEMKDLRSEMKDLRTEMKDLRAQMNEQHMEVLVRLATIDADLRQFYHLTGQLEGRVQALERR